jgi:hypothetical protein
LGSLKFFPFSLEIVSFQLTAACRQKASIGYRLRFLLGAKGSLRPCIPV